MTSFGMKGVFSWVAAGGATTFFGGVLAYIGLGA
jgi:hypothetical protein